MASKFTGNLVTKSGVKPASEVLAGKKNIGIYFSAHWCPPCRGFTPVLAKFYEAVKAAGKSDELEIVFASSDSDDHSFQEYYGSMPWTALPFDSDLKETLSSEFGVRGIPMFIVLGADGTVKDRDGRATVTQAGDNVATALAKWA